MRMFITVAVDISIVFLLMFSIVIVDDVEVGPHIAREGALEQI